MFRMYASNSNSYIHLIRALGIVTAPTVWVLLLQNILAYMTLASWPTAPSRVLIVVRHAERGVPAEHRQRAPPVVGVHERDVAPAWAIG